MCVKLKAKTFIARLTIQTKSKKKKLFFLVSHTRAQYDEKQTHKVFDFSPHFNDSQVRRLDNGQSASMQELCTYCTQHIYRGPNHPHPPPPASVGGQHLPEAEVTCSKLQRNHRPRRLLLLVPTRTVVMVTIIAVTYDFFLKEISSPCTPATFKHLVRGIIFQLR